MKSRLKAIRKYIEKHTDIADLGSGKGEYYFGVDLTNKNIVAIDIKDLFLSHIRWKLPTIKTLCRDAKDTGLPDKSFDLVIMSEVLEHIQDYEPALKEAKRICRDDGFFAVSVPIENYGHGHLHPIWSEDDVKKIANKLGDIIEINKLKNNWSIYIKNQCRHATKH